MSKVKNSDHTEFDERALDTFEAEGGALFDGPQLPSANKLPQQPACSECSTLWNLFGNPYISGVVSAAIYEVLRKIAALVF